MCSFRMAAETAIIIAHASGRVLVLPPETHWYLLDKVRYCHMTILLTLFTHTVHVYIIAEFKDRG